eukprot:COSAG05_NODE_1639_length_4360_cov_2.033795_4_plen_144_part_00
MRRACSDTAWLAGWHISLNILVSFFLDVYAFVTQNFTGHFQQSQQDDAKHHIANLVDHLHRVRTAQSVWGKWNADPHSRLDPTADLSDDPASPGANSLAVAAPPVSKVCCRSNYSARKCANCLLAEPAVVDVRSVHVPLFVPP